MEESNRQKKISGILQQDIASVIQDYLRKNSVKNLLISVSKVTVTSDLGYAKAYLSIFPADKADAIFKEITAITSELKHLVAIKVRHQLRRMPDLQFLLDDSLEYMDQIDRELKGENNPIINPDILPNRKKS